MKIRNSIQDSVVLSLPILITSFEIYFGGEKTFKIRITLMRTILRLLQKLRLQDHHRFFYFAFYFAFEIG